ncbi:hypothetical protein V5799_017233, partial [Amblyomma americanum]
SVKAALAGAGVLCGATPLSTTSAKFCFAVKENVFHGFLHSLRSAGLSHIHQNVVAEPLTIETSARVGV